MENKRLFDYNIFLIGFMGCGKSTIAGYLHDTFSMDVVEMDDIIAKREGMSLSLIHIYNSKDTEDASKEEETAESDSSISQIKSDYQKGTLDYAGVKNALAKLDTDKLESKEAEEVLALQEQTEKDLEDSLEKSAKSSDYESILKKLSKQKEEMCIRDSI